ncbi:hypothetical protein [Burkholderia multivorans]|uniref:hypothetical protein n=1 Tax=Burkholderia multivorans TaxID=87883 RepID=UPI001C20FC26|nr:hypothetical protein [Burkholderia multivorans]MBU9604322.1 hypothetical protein [Burkholderia multivorans]MBU9623682.1 hypothetical protein [Burkholderia multivorans]
MTNWVTNRFSERQSDLPLQAAEGIKFVVFDAFGTLCRIRDRRHPYGKLLRRCDDRSAALCATLGSI